MLERGSDPGWQKFQFSVDPQFSQNLFPGLLLAPQDGHVISTATGVSFSSGSAGFALACLARFCACRSQKVKGESGCARNCGGILLRHGPGGSAMRGAMMLSKSEGGYVAPWSSKNFRAWR